MTTFFWTGPIGRFNVTNDLGTAANWAPVSVPTATDSLTFSSRPGLLTGTVQGLNADFSGVGTWDLSGAQMTLGGVLTVDGTLSTTGASVTASSVAVNSGATLSGSGAVTGPITNNGTILASGGVLKLAGAVGGIGLLQIDVGAKLDVISASAGEAISFLGSTGTLVDHQVGSIGTAISGFVAGDTIDLRSLTFAPGAVATIAAGVLTVTSGATSETLSLTGLSNATTFSVTADASGIGTDIAIGAASSPPVSAPPPPVTPPTVSGPTPTFALTSTVTTPNQTVTLGAGDTQLTLQSTGTHVIGGSGNDFIVDGGGADTINLGSGSTTIAGTGGGPIIFGSSVSGSLFFSGGAAAATVFAGVGASTVFANGGGGEFFGGGGGSTMFFVGGSGARYLPPAVPVAASCSAAAVAATCWLLVPGHPR